MINRIGLTLILVMMIPAVHAAAEQVNSPSCIKIYGGSSVVDVSDLLTPCSGPVTDTGLKRLCAEITDRYHKKGYTAFYVKKAVLNGDGTAELFFVESPVAAVELSGEFSGREDIASAIYRKGELFNEFVLRDNISAAKKGFNLKRVSARIKRSEDDRVIITADLDQNNLNARGGIGSSPVYGALPGGAVKFFPGDFTAGVSAETSLPHGEREYHSGSVFLRNDNNGRNSYIELSADITGRRETLTDNNSIFYRHGSVTPAAGYCSRNGAGLVRVYAAGVFDQLRDYPGDTGGVSFSGAGIKLSYNDAAYKLDYSDTFSGELDLRAGWNFIEDSPVIKAVLKYNVNIPLLPRFFLSLSGDSLYTTDSGRFTQFYVFDRYLPCRSNDPAYASFVSVAGIDPFYELLMSRLYISPSFKWGVTNSGSAENSICAAGFRAVFTSGGVKAEASWLYDLACSVRKGFLMFSVTAFYL